MEAAGGEPASGDAQMDGAGADGSGAAEPPAEPAAKRPRTGTGAESEDEEGGPEAGGSKRRKRKLALVFGYIGTAYRGLMINYEVEDAQPVKSVEYHVRLALVRTGHVTAINAERLERKIGWSRSSRTDAGVSAVRLIISGRFLVLDDDIDAYGRNNAVASELNRALPEDIRCFGAMKVPNSFDAKRACSWREYEYLLPVAMCVPPAGADTADGRDGEAALLALRSAMGRFAGCHSFHNFSRIKARDFARDGAPASDEDDGAAHEADDEGDVQDGGVGAKGRSSRSKGKGKGKGKKGKGGKVKGKKGKADGESAPAPEAPEDAMRPGTDAADKSRGAGVGGGAVDAAAATTPAPVLAEAVGDEPGAGAAPAEAAVVGASAPIVPPWVAICDKDPRTGAFRERGADVISHSQSTMWLVAVEKTADSGFLRVRLRGQFFLYNQIRLMVGSAAAVARGALPAELIDIALQLPISMHMPLAPATGLFQRTSGFSMLDPRAGYAAMDAEQASLSSLPDSGFVLLDSAGTEAAEAFVLRVEEHIARLWRESDETEDWLKKIDEVRLPPAVLDELRGLAEEARRREAETRKLQADADERRRRRELEAPKYRYADLLPRRFATDLMLRFGLIPGWRTGHVQEALAARLRRWASHPGERPAGMPELPESEELLKYVVDVSVDALADEGARA